MPDGSTYQPGNTTGRKQFQGDNQVSLFLACSDVYRGMMRQTVSRLSESLPTPMSVRRTIGAGHCTENVPNQLARRRSLARQNEHRPHMWSLSAPTYGASPKYEQGTPPPRPKNLSPTPNTLLTICAYFAASSYRDHRETPMKPVTDDQNATRPPDPQTVAHIHM